MEAPSKEENLFFFHCEWETASHTLGGPWHLWAQAMFNNIPALLGFFRWLPSES